MERRQGKKLFWQLSDFECEKPNATGQERFGEGCGIVTPCPGLSGQIWLTGALPRSFTCSPLCWALVTGLLLRLLRFLLPSSPSHPSCSQCLQLSAAKLKTDESDHPVWNIPSTPTVQTLEGEGRAGKKVVIFKGDFYWSGSKPPASCIKPESGEVQDMWNHELRQELRIMKLMSSCLHSAANIVIQTQKWNRNPGYNKEAAAETVLQVQVTSMNADPFIFCSSRYWKQTLSMKLESYRRPNEVLLPYFLSRKLSATSAQLRHQQRHCISKCPKTEHVPCM